VADHTFFFLWIFHLHIRYALLWKRRKASILFVLTAKRHMAAAKRFFDKAIEVNGDPA
jgi:transposase-like protein